MIVFDFSTTALSTWEMGDLHLILTATNLSILDAGILIKMQQARLIMFSLNMVPHVLPLAVKN